MHCAGEAVATFHLAVMAPWSMNVCLRPNRRGFRSKVLLGNARGGALPDRPGALQTLRIDDLPIPMLCPDMGGNYSPSGRD